MWCASRRFCPSEEAEENPQNTQKARGRGEQEAAGVCAAGAPSIPVPEGVTVSPASWLDHHALLELVVERREEVREFEAFLRQETTWLTAPASTRFHLAREGGLLEHSVNVANVLLQLRAALAPDLSEESCVIVGLYHDLGKLGAPGNPYYLPSPGERQGQGRASKYVINETVVHMDIPTRSLYLIARHLPLTDCEAQAIRYHDGQYIDENKSVAHREEKLTRLVQYADNWACGVLEER